MSPGAPAEPSPPARARVLLIDDDRRLADMVVQYLAAAGIDVQHCGDAATGLHALAQPLPDAVLLDLGLPDADGLDVCGAIRRLPGAAGAVPVLMLTARGETTDRIVGLELGADDYLAKPFEPRELLARVRALIRRDRRDRQAVAPPPPSLSPLRAGSPGSATPPSNPSLRFGRLEIDGDARRVRVDGIDRELTAYQFDLLMTLARHAGRVLTRAQILDLVRGEPLEAFDRSIDVHVGRIRQAIEDDPKAPRRILTVRGVGYLMARLQDAA